MNSEQIKIDSKKGIFQSGKIVCPMVGFGSDRRLGQECTDLILEAADLGYRIIDSATAYKNLDAIAKALKQLDRSEFYLISKVWHDMLEPENLSKDLDSTLKILGTDYLDAYLIHWPNRSIAIDKTLAEMDKLRKQNKVRHIGICNVTVNHLTKLLEVGIAISWVQVQMNPNFFDKPLYELCQQHSIAFQAWWPLAFGSIQSDQQLIQIGQKYNKSASQVALRWIVENGCIPLPGSKNRTHMQENLSIMDFSLSQDDLQAINHRAIPGNRFRLRLDYGLGFEDEFDLSYEQCWDLKRS
ncbi:2,5-diketo-D-gluconic acid reductase A [Legionella massiliensis]|uniref:2,5-diketo-D-gluconic acid reductase A n=1 Tax=Legionella massiliensis TaxID=1034943 RepID=A0A078L209_9GAMM|nr:aldo/keto reductase [Legionella massiliensis]CDZ79277.1 2,5-diketo-D-gluconic acid reductase A [Legionella massiliensis]CEE15015.1 2,5-diketo-D-gluconic acid reductase A [Legionella massiliensis]